MDRSRTYYRTWWRFTPAYKYGCISNNAKIKQIYLVGTVFFNRRDMMSQTSQQIIDQTQAYGAKNYHPLPVVVAKAEGVWVEDPEGNRYMDMLSAYSAVNQGHRHPKIMHALKDQSDKVTLTSRAFHNDQLGPWYENICKLTNKD